MIRVLNIISDTNIGGAGRVILNYLNYTDKSRFETLVAVPRGSLLKEPLEQAGAKVYEVDGMADRSYHKDDVKLLKELIRRVKPDLVHTHGAFSGRIAARRLPCARGVQPALRLSRPRQAEASPRPVGEQAGQRALRRPDHRRQPRHPGQPHRRGHLPQKDHRGDERGGSGGARLRPGPRQLCGRRFGIPADTVVFGILARIEDYKGHLYLVEAAQSFKGPRAHAASGSSSPVPAPLSGRWPGR